MPDTAVSYAFEQLEPSQPQPRDAPARALAQAQLEAEQIREQARSEGYAEGRNAGHEQGATEIVLAARALAAAMDGIESLRVELVQAIEHDAIQLGLQLAEKILGGTRQLPSEHILESVQGALRRVTDRRKIAVLVNPAEFEAVSSAIGGLAGPASGVELCDIQPDERVEPGGAIVRTAEGEVDAGVETQLERAREVVEASLAAERAA
ncbi:MAG TPA: FliH/SctL family protein [Solirubrobacteraceae bacterium]|nr:FliH/SctL family protein [Solirubrobacteraceae bacterium]